jgi:uncharacterized alkaline shock family protein YloU
MKPTTKFYAILKTILFTIILIHLFSFFKTKPSIFQITVILSIIILIIDFIFNFKAKQLKIFKIQTEFGQVKISEKVIENVISIILRKYKLVKHYVCQVYNKKDLLFIVLNVDVAPEYDDILAEIMQTLRESIKENIEKNIGTIKIGYIDIVIDKIKRSEKDV